MFHTHSSQAMNDITSAMNRNLYVQTPLSGVYYRSIRDNVVRRTCIRCKKPHMKASHECTSCNLPLCIICSVEHRKECICRNEGNNLRISDNFDSSFWNEKLCDNHGVKISFFCQTCGISACVYCITTLHNKHNYDKLTVVIKSTAECTYRMHYIAKSKLDTTNQAIEELTQSYNEVNRHSIAARHNINSFFNGCNLTYTAQREVLHKEVIELNKVKVRRLLQQWEQLRIQSFTLNIILNGLNKIVETACFGDNMHLQRDINNVSRILEQIPCSTKIAETGSIEFTLQTNMQTDGQINWVGTVQSEMSSEISEQVLPILRPLSLLEHNIIGSPFKSIKGIEFCNATVKKPRTPSQPSMVIGGSGTDFGKLSRPWGICTTNQGHILVAERGNNRIQIFSSTGNFILTFGKSGTDPGCFNKPAGLCVDGNNRIIVADKDNHRIQIFCWVANIVQFELEFGSKHTDDGGFEYPWDVACNSLGHIAVADTRHARIQLFNCNGQFMAKFAFKSCDPSLGLNQPRGVVFARLDELLTTDFNNHHIVRINIINNKAGYINFRKTHPSGGFQRPQGLFCDANANVVVADSKNERILILSRHCEVLHTINTRTLCVGSSNRIVDVSLLPDGRIVAVDFGNDRILVF